jgi:hypothetical protein
MTSRQRRTLHCSFLKWLRTWTAAIEFLDKEVFTKRPRDFQ